MRLKIIATIFAASFYLCPLMAQDDDVLRGIKSVKEVDTGLGFKNKEVEFYEKGDYKGSQNNDAVLFENRYGTYGVVLQNHRQQYSNNENYSVKVYQSGGIQIDNDPPAWVKSRPQSRSSQTAIRNRKIRNAQIEEHNQEVREHNRMIDEQRKLDEERREAERKIKDYLEQQRKYNAEYNRVMNQTAGRFNRQVTFAIQQRENMEVLKDAKIDHLSDKSGFIPSEGETVDTRPRQRTSLAGIVSKGGRPSITGLDFHDVPITQISDASSPDFLSIEIPTRRTYRAIEMKPELTWEWVREHPEDTWAWIKDKVTNVDEFLDYQEAVASGKDNIFTNTVRRKYMDLKMEWYNHDMTERISSAYSTTITTIKAFVDNPDAIREDLKEKVVENAKGYVKDNMLKPVPMVTKFINENTLLHIPTIEMKSLENAKDLIGLKDVAKVLDKDFAKSAVDAVYNGDIAYMQIIDKKQNEVVIVVHRQTGRVLGRELGIDTNKALIEPTITSIDAFDKSKAEIDDKSKVKVYVSNTFVPYVRKDITKRAKRSVVNDFKDIMEEELNPWW